MTGRTGDSQCRASHALVLVQPTPFERLGRLSGILGVNLWAKRDDLYPLTGGGNKARKIVLIAAEAEKSGCNALVTCGGAQSNHCRVVALVAAAKGWRCRLLIHADPKETIPPRGNFLLMKLAGAEIEFIRLQDAAEAMRSAMRDLVDQGVRPFEIVGGGHSVAGAIAYVTAVDELAGQCKADGWQPDWLIHASGTGTTQAGIAVGIERLGWPTRVVGISVARGKARGTQVIEQSCSEIRKHLGFVGAPRAVDFRDTWVGEGYEKAGPEVLDAIRLACRTEGLVLDPTYTGKAFAGLLSMVGDGEIASGSKVLLWHTGGLLNLMASADVLPFESPNRARPDVDEMRSLPS